MGRHHRRGNQHEVTIGKFTFTVDSNLEERVIRHLHANGFEHHWRPGSSIEYWSYNYTPDLELSVRVGNMTHRALVEIKPALAKFYTDGKNKDDIAKRMAGVSKYYHFALLLLYAEEEDTWYKIDSKNYNLSVFGEPKPGVLPIERLKAPKALFTRKGRKKFDKQYRKREGIGMKLAKGVVAVADEFLQPKPKRSRRRRR